MNDRLFFTAATSFQAARQIELLPPGHRSRYLHGHSFLAKVFAELPSSWASFPGAEVAKLRQRLSIAVAPLDYSYLNDTVVHPTNGNLARWIKDHLDLETVANIALQSTEHKGVNLLCNGHVHIWRRYTIESAHRLPNVPLGHKCGRMHGHSFQIILHTAQDLKVPDTEIEYDHLDRVWHPVYEELNLVCLNDIPGLENPTSEIISSWLWDRLKPTLPELSWVTVYETASCGAHFDGLHYRIWKEMSFDSAVQLNGAPKGDLRRRIHGHTYALRLHLRAPLDDIMGWTVDFGDVKELFNPIFKALDHQPLYERLTGIDTDTASLVRWIRDQVQSIIPELDRIDLWESRSSGVTLAWGDVAPALQV